MGPIILIYTAIYTLETGGSKPPQHLIINQKGRDRLNAALSIDGGSFLAGEGMISRNWSSPIDDQNIDLDEVYVRLLTTHDDKWKPATIFIWGLEISNKFIPLAYNSAFYHSLSTDTPDEGLPSIPVKRVLAGSDDMSINRLLLIVKTSNADHARTTSALKLFIKTDNGATVKVDHQFKKFWSTGYPDAVLEKGSVKIYDVPIRQTFSKSELSTGDIELKIYGNDLWIPEEIWLFGIIYTDDITTNEISHMLILARTHTAGPLLSEDPDEGQSSLDLPIV